MPLFISKYFVCKSRQRGQNHTESPLSPLLRPLIHRIRDMSFLSWKLRVVFTQTVKSVPPPVSAYFHCRNPDRLNRLFWLNKWGNLSSRVTKKRLLSVPKCRGLLSNNLKVVWISSAAWMRNGEQGKPEDSNQEWNLCEIFLSKWQQSAVKCHKLTVICINRAVNAVMWFVWYIWYVMSCSGARFQWPWIWRALVMKLIQDRPEKSQPVVPSPGAAQLDGHYCIALFFV